jgi:hypothetical protein
MKTVGRRTWDVGRKRAYRTAKRYIIAMLFLCFMPCTSVLLAQEPPLPQAGNDASSPIKDAYDSLSITGNNTMRYEYYDVIGNEAMSPYQSKGSQFYNEFDMTMTQRNSPYDTWRTQIVGVLNDSAYRSTYHGVVPERLSFFKEKGDTFLPYRFEAGDYFSNLSLRTMQQSLKGAQLEFQPGSSDIMKNSLLFFSGASNQTWRDFTPSRNYSSGASYLMEHSTWGKMSLNYVNNMQSRDESSRAQYRMQNVMSFAGEKEIKHKLGSTTFEGELGYFNGDHNGQTTPDTGQNKDDFGLFFETRGNGASRQFNYRARFERYGQDYRPQGATITPDRQAVEGYASWRFLTGMELRGRTQFYRDAVSTNNRNDTNTYGLNLSGPFFSGFTGSIDGFIQDTSNEQGTSKSINNTLSVNLNKPLAYGVNFRPSFFFQKNHSRVANTDDTTTIQPGAGFDVPIAYKNITGIISPGIVYRRVNDGNSSSDNFTFTLSMNLNRNPHSLTVDFNTISQRYRTDGVPDVVTFSPHVLYKYVLKEHTFGMEFNYDGRSPDPGTYTKSTRVAAFWTYHFDKPSKQMTASAPARAFAEKQELTHPLRFDDLVPGINIKTALTRLSDASIKSPTELPGLFIYNTPFFEEVMERQKLALVQKGLALNKSLVVIDFDDLRNSNTVMQSFERTRDAMIKRFGAPTSTFDRGNVTVNLINDINNGSFIRLTEWIRPGGTIRFGIPRRVDGRIRMELQYAPSFPSPTETLWSVEEVR